MSTQPPWQRPPSGQPPQAPAQPPPETAPTQPTAPAPGAVQAPPPPAPGAPAPPPAEPPVYAPPPGGPRKTNTKLILAIVGAVAALGIIGSIVVVAGGKDEPAPQPANGPNGTGNQPTPDPDPDPVPPDPPAPDLQSLIQESVGPYTLVAAEQNPEAIGNGAADAYVVKYEAGGVELGHDLIAFNSAEEAQTDQEGLFGFLQEKGFVAATEPQRLDDENGEQIGVLVIFVNEQTGAEIWAWSNRNLSLTAFGDAGKVEVFYTELPY